MKKIFTTLAMLAAVATMSAADAFVIQKGANAEETYADGATINVMPVVAAEYDDFKQLLWDPELFVKANEEVTVSVTVESEYGMIQFCGFDGQCQLLMSGNGKVTKTKKIAKGAVEGLQIDLNDYGMVTESQVVKVTAQSATQTVNLTLNFVYNDNSSLTEIAGGNAIALRGRVLDYNFKTPTQVTLYTIAGQAALSRTVNGTGSINLDALPGGVYLYRAGNKTGKFIVR